MLLIGACEKSSSRVSLCQHVTILEDASQSSIFRYNLIDTMFKPGLEVIQATLNTDPLSQIAGSYLAISIIENPLYQQRPSLESQSFATLTKHFTRISLSMLETLCSVARVAYTTLPPLIELCSPADYNKVSIYFFIYQYITRAYMVRLISASISFYKGEY